MNIVFLEMLGNKGVGQPLARERAMRPEERISFNLVAIAARRTASLAHCFVDRICIGDLATIRSGGFAYAKNSKSLWVHDGFFKDIPSIYSLDELVSIFLHETAHHIEHLHPGYIEQFLRSDPAWIRTLACFTEIKKTQLEEVYADAYALRIGGRAYISALPKPEATHFSHAQMAVRFPENNVYPSLDTRLRILSDYAWAREHAERLAMRMPFRTQRPKQGYKITQSESEDENGLNEQQDYFSYVVTGDYGYDFLQSLLKLHPAVSFLPNWKLCIETTKDKDRQDKTRQFAHDVLTLMKLLLGSANMYVDAEGFDRFDDLPYGAVRSLRAALTRTALGGEGSIERIKTMIRSLSQDKLLLEEINTGLDTLHMRLSCPSFAAQEAIQITQNTKNLIDVTCRTFVAP